MFFLHLDLCAVFPSHLLHNPGYVGWLFGRFVGLIGLLNGLPAFGKEAMQIHSGLFKQAGDIADLAIKSRVIDSAERGTSRYLIFWTPIRVAPTSAVCKGDQKILENDEIFVRFIGSWEYAFVVEDVPIRPRCCDARLGVRELGHDEADG